MHGGQCTGQRLVFAKAFTDAAVSPDLACLCGQRLTRGQAARLGGGWSNGVKVPQTAMSHSGPWSRAEKDGSRGGREAPSSAPSSPAFACVTNSGSMKCDLCHGVCAGEAGGPLPDENGDGHQRCLQRDALGLWCCWTAGRGPAALKGRSAVLLACSAASAIHPPSRTREPVIGA